MLLLDTCVLVWLDSDPAKLSAAAQQAMREYATALFASPISALELAIKCRKGKLALPLPVEQWFPAVLAAHGISEQPLSWPAAVLSAQLPPVHSDPFDRILVATTQLAHWRIVTPDPLIHAYPDVDAVW